MGWVNRLAGGRELSGDLDEAGKMQGSVEPNMRWSRNTVEKRCEMRTGDPSSMDANLSMT